MWHSRSVRQLAKQFWQGALHLSRAYCCCPFGVVVQWRHAHCL